jgi:hypothetical protein
LTQCKLRRYAKETEAYLHSFLASALSEGELRASQSGRFIPGVHRIGVGVILTEVLEIGEEKNLFRLSRIEPLVFESIS